MKRWLATCMVVAMLFALCGCGSDTKTTITKKEDNASDTAVGSPSHDLENNDDEWAIHEERGHFFNETASPEMSGEGPKADVREAYFTNSGHLCVELLISNGTDRPLQITAVDVAAYDYDLDVMFAGGKGDLAEPLSVAVGEVAPYTFYISPEHVQLDAQDALPALVYFVITLDSVPV